MPLVAPPLDGNATLEKSLHGPAAAKNPHHAPRRIHVPADLKADDYYLPLPATAARANPRLFYVFRADFHRACARNIAPAELLFIAFLILTGTLGTTAALARAFVVLHAHANVYSVTEFVLVLLAHAHALAFVHWVHRVVVEKVKAAWSAARERRGVRFI